MSSPSSAPPTISKRKIDETDLSQEQEQMEPISSLSDVISDMSLDLWYHIFQHLWLEVVDAELKQKQT